MDEIKLPRWKPQHIHIEPPVEPPEPCEDCERLTADLAAARSEVERLTELLEQERQFICRKCGLREELGKKTEANF